MYRLFIMLVLTLTIAVLSGLAMAQMSNEDQIKVRQSAYTFIGWNMNRIRAQVIDQEVEFNPAQIQQAANAIAAVANSGMSALYGPGTHEGSGWKPTRLKAEFFDELDQVGEIAGNFIQQANALQEVAGGGDQAAIAGQFRQLADACGACHRNYRAPE